MLQSVVLSGSRVTLLLVVWLLCFSRCLGDDDGGGGENSNNRAKAEEKKSQKNEIRIDNLLTSDEEGISSVDGYEEVKETLRKIFAKAVIPKERKQEEEYRFKDYLVPEIKRFDPEGRDEGFPRAKNLVSPTGRRRNVLLEDEEAINEAQDYISSEYRNEEKISSHRASHFSHSGREDTKAYLNEWVVHLTGGTDVAAAVARDLGYDFLGQVGTFEDVYRLVKKDHPTVHKREAPTLTKHLNRQTQVLWAEQQFAKERAKRGIYPLTDYLQEEGDYDPYAPLVRVKRTGDSLSGEAEDEKEREENARRDAEMAAEAFAMENMFNDELWVHQWYLFDTRTRGDLPRLDLEVVSVWGSGITGKGVRVLVLDDGLEWTHTDIAGNYDRETSYDLNDNDDNPAPRYDDSYTNSHGTRCAGEIAMAPNNRKCGVGVAFGAKVGGVRMLDGPVSDAVEGAALSTALDKVDIVTCSWGPTDDGKRVEGPGKLAQMAFEKGIKEGRGGKGTIYVWAAGNGGSSGDNCNCDGYTSSVYTLSISSASERGEFPWYGERCASTLATAYSSGAYTDQKIVTTDLNDQCTDTFSGTSAAAPLAAGIFALALEVNPDLTWRDLQHAVVWSSEWATLGHNEGWYTNARGLHFNPRFGYGLLSAEGLVHAVANWTNVPEKKICTLSPTKRSSNTLSSGNAVLVDFETEDCEGATIRSLEHVQVIASISYSRRGALALMLTSPGGTETHLLTERDSDSSGHGFKEWSFMSVHTWGEDPSGRWTLNISDSTNRNESGSIDEVKLVLHGTVTIPEHMRTERRYRFAYVKKEAHRVVEQTNRDITFDQLKKLS